MIRKIIIFGPQGSGKGAQAMRLSDEYGFVHISTGMLLRDMSKNPEGLSDKTKSYLKNELERGILASDEIVNEIVRKRLKMNDVLEKGYILDGYPRTMEQANFLNSVSDISDLVLIDVSDEECIKRISGRVVSKSSGKTYHKEFDPPPIGEEVYVREDDKEEIVKKRLKEYHNKTRPILEIYENKGVLRKVNGEMSIEEVYLEIKKALNLI